MNGTQSSFRNWEILNTRKDYVLFSEPEDSLPFSQQLATEFYSESVELNPQPENSIKIWDSF